MSDLYATLGVSTRANLIEIKRAYRELAKSAHPDIGGDAEAFRQIEIAHRVLSDPAKRALYDSTGEIDDGATKLAPIVRQAMERISGLVESMVNDPKFDPLPEPMITRMRDALRLANDKFRERQAICDHAKALAEKVLPRFKRKTPGDNLLAAMVRGQITAAENTKAKLDELIAVNERASEMLAEYSFEQDAPPPRIVYFGSISSSSSGTIQ